ncbi:MAG: TonB-dependent receptor [bacterium]
MGKRSFMCLIIGLLCLGPVSLPGAEEEVHYLDPVIVSVDRIPQTLTQSTSSVTVISGEELADASPARIDEILRGTLGASINTSGTPGETISVRLRGSGNNQTMVLIDGMKVNSPWNGAYGEWGNTEMTDIGRIEIIRGPQSELYGSEAIGGVVHLFTGKGEDSRGLEISLGGGSFKTKKESLEYAGGGENVNFLLSAYHTKSRGQYDNKDAYRNAGLAAGFGWQASPLFSLKAVCRYRENRKELAVNPDEFFFLDSNASVYLGPDNPDKHQQTMFWDNDGVRRDRFFLQTLSAEGDPSRWWHYRLNAGYLQDHYRAEKGLYYGTTTTFIADILSDRLSVGTQHDFTLSDELPNTFSLGVEYEQETVDAEQDFTGDPNDIIPPLRSVFFDTVDKNRHNLSLFFQNRLEVHPLTITAGLRWDDNSAYGEVFSPRISESFCIDPTKTRLKASWAQGYRAPNFQELYFPFLGNPDLKPEKCTGFEAGFEQPILDRLSIGCTYFHTKFEDLISKPGGARNINAAVVEGIEGELAWDPLPSLGFRISYTWLDSQDKKTNKELTDRPNHTVKIAADYSYAGFSVHPLVNIVSSEYADYASLDLQGNPIKERNPGYTRVDVTFQYEIVHQYASKSHCLSKGRLQWYGRINNLFDEDYCEVQGFPTPGINFMTGITAAFY